MTRVIINCEGTRHEVKVPPRTFIALKVKYDKPWKLGRPALTIELDLSRVEYAKFLLKYKVTPVGSNH